MLIQRHPLSFSALILFSAVSNIDAKKVSTYISKLKTRQHVNGFNIFPKYLLVQEDELECTKLILYSETKKSINMSIIVTIQ